MNLTAHERGVGHIGIVAIVVVLVAVTGAGWFVFNKQNKDTATNSATKELLANAKCDYDDKDLCKFFASYKANKSYSMKAISTAREGKTAEIIYKIDGEKSYSKLDINGVPQEGINIGTTVYTRNTPDGTWWKQTIAEPKVEAAGPIDTTFKEPTKDGSSKDKVTYKSLGKEKCSNLNCFKYQVFQTDDAELTQYIWFDTKDYQLRRATTSTKEGIKADITFNYDKVSIDAPSPTQDLPAGSYLIPGQSQPVTMPAAGDTPSQAELDALMQQYQNAQ